MLFSHEHFILDEQMPQQLHCKKIKFSSYAFSPVIYTFREDHQIEKLTYVTMRGSWGDKSLFIKKKMPYRVDMDYVIFDSNNDGAFAADDDKWKFEISGNTLYRNSKGKKLSNLIRTEFTSKLP